MSMLWISILFCVVVFTSACDQPPGWAPRSIEDRASEVNTVILGTVHDTTDGAGGGPCRSDTECGFWANIVVECVLKDDTGISVGSVVKVTGFGVNSDCTQTQIIRTSNDIKYILLLSASGINVYTVSEVNAESAATRVTNQQIDTYADRFPESVCRQTTLAPTTTIPTTQKRTTQRTTRRSTSPKMLSTIAMKQPRTTKFNKKGSGAQLDIKPTTNASSGRITISFIVFAVGILTLLI